MKVIDVIMPTSNSNSRFFRRVLKSILVNIPLHNLIVIDKFSKDGTIDVIKKVIPSDHLIIVKTEANLAVARAIGINLVSTEWFAFVDSDIELCNGWFQKLMRYKVIAEKIGAIQGSYWNPFAGNRSKKSVESIRFLRRRKDIKLKDIIKHGLLNVVRGLTTNTLIKKEAAQDWNPPVSLSAFEDYHLTQHILKKGFKWVVVEHIKSIHWKQLSYSNAFRSGVWHGVGARFSGAKSPLEMMIFTPAYLIRKTLCNEGSDDCKNLLMEFILQLGWVIGFFMRRSEREV